MLQRIKANIKTNEYTEHARNCKKMSTEQKHGAPKIGIVICCMLYIATKLLQNNNNDNQIIKFVCIIYFMSHR